MSAFDFVKKADEPRVLVVSQRQLKPIASRCMTYEFEDLIASMDCADVVAITRSLALPRWRRRLDRLLRRPHARRSGAPPISRRTTPMIDRRYRILFVNCQSLSDLADLGPIAPWRACADIAICRVEELWTRSIPSRCGEIAILGEFDLVFDGCNGSVAALSDAIARPCAYLPPGIDAALFTPQPDPPQRVIDVYSMGRRAPRTHGALLEWARSRRRLYLYDSLKGYHVKDAAEHRFLLANLIKRSRYFIANRAKANVAAQTDNQEEVGFRFFEGAAGGAIMIGDPPSTPSFEQNFGWKDAVVRLPFDSPDVPELIDSLDADPARTERIRAENTRNSLLRHDWVYRWSAILEAAGIDPLPAAVTRRELLARLAEQAGDVACVAA